MPWMICSSCRCVHRAREKSLGIPLEISPIGWIPHRHFELPESVNTQIHPTCIPVSGDHQSKLTLMSESLRNDGRIWVPKKKDDTRKPTDIPEEERDYYLERRYPAFGNLVPRDVASRAAKEIGRAHV